MEKRLPRPDLRISSAKWSAAKTSSSFFTRVALVTTIGAILGGISLVFLYPYLNIDDYRKLIFFFSFQCLHTYVFLN